MSFLTLILVVFFSLYNGIGSKITNKKVTQIGDSIDSFSINLIENFIEKNNKELFPILEKYNKKLALYSFYILVIGLFFGVGHPFLLSGVFFSLLFLSIPLLPPKEFQKAFLRFVKEVLILSTFVISFCLFYQYIEAYLPIEFQELNNQIIEALNKGFQKIKVPMPVFVGGILIIIMLCVFILIIMYKAPRAILWYLLIPICRQYSKFCKWLNEDQPLKPFYLLSKTIIVFATYFLTP